MENNIVHEKIKLKNKESSYLKFIKIIIHLIMR